MQVVQIVKATKKDSKTVRFMLLQEEGNVFSVLMEDTAFAAGKVFQTAKDAVTATVALLNSFLSDGSKIVHLHSAHGEEFVTNEAMNQLL